MSLMCYTLDTKELKRNKEIQNTHVIPLDL